jgi:hypothetical protein
LKPPGGLHVAAKAGAQTMEDRTAAESTWTSRI